MCKRLSGEISGLQVAITHEQMTPEKAARKLLLLYNVDERDLLVERKELQLVEPLESSLNDHYGDRRQRIVIAATWTLDDFKALVAWLAAPYKKVAAPQAPPPRRKDDLATHRGRKHYRQLVTANT